MLVSHSSPNGAFQLARAESYVSLEDESQEWYALQIVHNKLTGTTHKSS